MISLICFLLSPEMEMIGKIDVWFDCWYWQAVDNVEHSVKTRREICSQRLSLRCAQGPHSFRSVAGSVWLTSPGPSGPSHHQISFLSSSGSGNTTDRISHPALHLHSNNPGLRSYSSAYWSTGAGECVDVECCCNVDPINSALIGFHQRKKQGEGGR